MTERIEWCRVGRGRKCHAFSNGGASLCGWPAYTKGTRKDGLEKCKICKSILDEVKISEVLFSLLREYRTYFWGDDYTEDVYRDKEKLRQIDFLNLEKTITRVDFKNKGRIHEWKNYVDEVFIRNWEQLSLEDRALLFYFAVKEAHEEFWD